MTSTRTKRVLVALVGLLVLFAGACVHASSLTVSPTRIPLSGKHRAVTVRLLNLGNEPLTVQAHVVAWTLSENRDAYRDSDDVLLNPPIVTLEPQKPQLIRLGLRRPYLEGGEIAYRLIVEEVPPAPKPGVMGLRTILRITIPIFVAPPGGERKQLDLNAERMPGGMKITATNNGNAHVQIRRLDLSPEASSDAPARQKVLDYLLPGQTRAWIFEEAQIRAAQKLALTVVTDAESFSVSLVPANR